MDFSNTINLNDLTIKSTETIAGISGIAVILIGVVLALTITGFLLDLVSGVKKEKTDKNDLVDDDDDDII